MSVSKCIASKDVVNGASVVLSGENAYQQDDQGRTERLTTTGGVLTFDVLASRSRAGRWVKESITARSGDMVAASGQNAVMTYPAKTLQSHVISALQWSYNTTVASGNLKVESPAGTSLFEEFVDRGPNGFTFGDGLKGQVGQAMVITLAGQSGVSGRINAQGHRLE